MTLRIGVSGAQGVGKTTFCEDLQDALDRCYPEADLSVYRDVARSLKREGVNSDVDTRPEEYALYLRRHIQNLLRSDSADIAIFDRTVFDTVAYAGVNNNLHTDWLGFLKVLARFTLRQFDVYFFVPVDPAIPLRTDGVRSPDIEYQAQLDDLMEALIKELLPGYIELMGSRESRVKAALSAIEKRCQL